MDKIKLAYPFNLNCPCFLVTHRSYSISNISGLIKINLIL